MARREEEERKGNLVLAAIIGAAGLAIGWAVLELGFGAILNPAKEEEDPKEQPPPPAKDPAVLVEEVANEAKKKEVRMKEFPDTRTQSQIEEDEIVEALDEGTLHDINKQRREQQSR